MFATFKASGRQNICVFGANVFAVSVAAVIASKCPNINVSVVNFNSDQVIQWQKINVKAHEHELEDLLKKCNNSNLIFTTDITQAILVADIIMLMMDSTDFNPARASDTKLFEEAARRIAEVAEKSKIIVEKCLNVPLRACKTLKLTLEANKTKNSSFQVLAMPEFFTKNNAVSYLLKPEFVFIGHEPCPEGEKAAATLEAIYGHWVPKEKIKKMSWVSAELSKIAINAILAQKSMSIDVFSAICEQSGKNIRDVTKVLRKTSVGHSYLESMYTCRNINQYRDTANLARFCKEHGFTEMADYWQEIIKQYDWQEIRFEKKIFSAFFNTLNKKKLAIFGVSMEGSSNITSESPAIRLSARMLEEGGELSLYEPRVKLERERVVEALKECGVEEGVEDRVTLFEDPHKAAEKVHGIILCSDWKELKGLDFATIYRDMMKPAHIFDRRNVLDHEFLMKMGFKVQAVGRAS